MRKIYLHFREERLDVGRENFASVPLPNDWEVC